MKEYSAFDILGPIMIGPSSSHTAGAARLGKIAKEIAKEGFSLVEFYLHGSFAKTYRGHGTDKALVAGILGFQPSDENLRDSFRIADEEGISIEFIETDLGYHHPNTVKIVFKYEDGQDFYVLGSSIGGGNVIVYNINGDAVEFTGSYPTIILKYNDAKGIINKISSVLASHDINIATMKVSREGNIATMICEIDSSLNDDVRKAIENIEDISYSRFLNAESPKGQL